MIRGDSTPVETASGDLHELAALQERARGRGYKPVIVGLLTGVGLVPTVLATTLQGPGYSNAPIILVLFAIVPLVLLFGWTVMDREGQAARELTMWLQSLQRSSLQAASERAPIVATASIPWRGRALQEVSQDFRAALAPFVRGGRGLQARIAVNRFRYPIAWGLVAIVAIGLFALVLGLTPECSSIDPGPGAICH